MAAPIGDAKDIAEYETKFQSWKQENPGKRFSDFAAEQLIRHLSLGRTHASLGVNLNSGEDWKKQGKAPYDALIRFLTTSTQLQSLPKDFAVCDYGCGTLRLGVHLMEHLDPEKYCGLDLSDDLIDFGRNECTDLIAQKKPLIGTFANLMPQASTINFDLVFSFNVACHVHPEEMDDYVNNILKLAAKPGCISILHFITHSEPTSAPLRHQRSGWAWPRKAVTELFKPLHLVNEIHFQDVQKGPHSLSSYYMVFQTPAA